MSASIHEAAAELYKQIRAPVGSINTLAFSEGSEAPYIRVLIDPRHWPLARQVPPFFLGFRVVIEKRKEIRAGRAPVRYARTFRPA